MEFDENLNPVSPPTQPNPWNQPPPYQGAATPTPTTPLVTPPPVRLTDPTPPPFNPPLTPPAPILNLPPTPPIKPKELPTDRPPKPPYIFPMAIYTMMFVITLVSMILAFASSWFEKNQNNTITVSGTGIAYSAPDVAKIDFGVRSDARNLADSQKLNANAIAKIKNDLAPFEIKPEDIQTINYNINPDYIYPSSQKPSLSGYTTYHFLRLTMRKLDMVDSILQTLGNSGATDISQISFTIDDPIDVKNEAREKAIVSAKDMANQLASLSGVKLGKIISIQEEVITPNDNNPQLMGGGMGGGGNPGIEAGSLSATSNITIVYSLQ